MRNILASTALAGASVALTLAAGDSFAQTALPPTTVTAAPAQPPQTPAQAQEAANRPVVQQTQNLDQRRDNALLPKIGANTYQLTQQDIASLPQGQSVPARDVALQFPGVYQDSAASGYLHVRNDHANVQYRINGILLPDGVSGFGQLLDTSFIGSMQLLTGALP